MFVFNTKAGRLFRSDLISGVDGVVHGFGVKGVSVSSYLDALGVEDHFLVDTDQIHGNRVHCLMWPRKGGVLKGDAFISDRPGMVCFVRGADCVPILIADTKRLGVAAVHAGWRGTACDAVGEAFRAMSRVFGTSPSDCVAAIGPGICGGCYEVGRGVVDAIASLGIGREWKIDDRHVDLGIANKLLLERAGLSEAKIDLFTGCTHCDGAFASYRRDRDEALRQVSFILCLRQRSQGS